MIFEVSQVGDELIVIITSVIIFFTNETLMRFDCKEYDLDILILELDRVCNPKELKGKLDEK